MQRRPSPVLGVYAIFFCCYVSQTKDSLFSYDKWQSLAIFKTNKYIPMTGFFFQDLSVSALLHRNLWTIPFLLWKISLFSCSIAPESCKIRIKSAIWWPLSLGIWQGIPVPRLISVSQIIYTEGTSLPPPGGAAFHDSSLSLPLCLTAQILAVKQPYCPRRSEAQTAFSFSSPKMTS